MKIAAFCFEKLGFEYADNSEIPFERGKIRFVYLNNPIRLDLFDGVIFPSKIFENFVKIPNSLHDIWKVGFDQSQLLQREKEVWNLIQNKGWVCCLTDAIYDSIPKGYEKTKITDTDLSKLILNRLNIGREPFSGSSDLRCVRDEFRYFYTLYGIAKTYFRFDSRRPEIRPLFFYGKLVVGFEWEKQAFFLPFHSATQTTEILHKVSIELTNSITDYRQKMIVEFPKWVEAYKLPEEEKLEAKIVEYKRKLEGLNYDLERLREYKGLLVFSGEALKNSVVNTLRDFFRLEVSDEENFKEDAIILDGSEKKAVIEIKGTNGGVKRGFLSQLDANRERIGLSDSVPGVLIINDQMDVSSIEKRRQVTVSDEQIKFAANLNITIIQTTELWCSLSRLSSQGAKENFMSWITKGGGRLFFEEDQFKIIT